MNRICKTYAIIASLLLAFSAVQSLYAQSDSVPVSADSGSVNRVKKTGSHALYLGTGYGNNMIYLGSTISRNNSFGYSALTYGYRNKLFLGISGVHFSAFDPFMAFSSATLSFSHEFNSWFDVSSGFSGYRVAPSLRDTLFSNFAYGEVTLGIDWRLLYTKISAGGLVSDKNSYYFQIRNSRYFETPEFTKRKFTFSFDPYINILFGELVITEYITGTKVVSKPHMTKKKPDPVVPAVTKTTWVFGPLETDFGIQVSLNASRFTIEVEPGYILPMYEADSYSLSKGFIFLLNIYFKVF